MNRVDCSPARESCLKFHFRHLTYLTYLPCLVDACPRAVFAPRPLADNAIFREAAPMKRRLRRDTIPLQFRGHCDAFVNDPAALIECTRLYLHPHPDVKWTDAQMRLNYAEADNTRVSRKP